VQTGLNAKVNTGRPRSLAVFQSLPEPSGFKRVNRTFFFFFFFFFFAKSQAEIWTREYVYIPILHSVDKDYG
jgi:hypothetical protein